MRRYFFRTEERHPQRRVVHRRRASSARPAASRPMGHAACPGKTCCCRRYTPIARKTRPLTKKFFICRWMLAKTKAGAAAGSSHSKSVLPAFRRLDAEQQQRRHHVSGDHEAKSLAHGVQLRPTACVADAIQREVDPRVDQEQVFDLAAGPGRGRLQPVGVRLVERGDAAQRGPGEGHGEGVEVLRVVGDGGAVRKEAGREEQRGAGQQVEVEPARIVVEPVQRAHAQQRRQAEHRRHRREDQRETGARVKRRSHQQTGRPGGGPTTIARWSRPFEPGDGRVPVGLPRVSAAKRSGLFHRDQHGDGSQQAKCQQVRDGDPEAAAAPFSHPHPGQRTAAVQATAPPARRTARGMEEVRNAAPTVSIQPPDRASPAAGSGGALPGSRRPRAPAGARSVAQPVVLVIGHDLFAAPAFQVAQMLLDLCRDQSGVGGRLRVDRLARQEAAQVVSHFARRAVARGADLLQRLEADVLQVARNPGVRGAAVRVLLANVASSSPRVSAWNGGSPVSSSYSTRPARRRRCAHPIRRRPTACSGERYSGVPAISPIRESRWPPPRSSASPKSRSFGSRSGPTRMLAGFRSRWTMPCACRKSTASTTLRINSGLLLEVEAGGGSRQGRAFQILHHEVRRLVGRPEIIDARDVRVAQPRHGARLVHEARPQHRRRPHSARPAS